MKRAVLAICGVAFLGSTFCGCSGARPFWTASKSKTNSNTAVASTSSTDQTGSFLKERAKARSAERSVEGPIALARLAEHGGSPIEAERLYRSIMEKHPDSVTAAHRLAIMQAQKGHFEEADQLFRKALEVSPDDPALLSDAAYHYYLDNQLDEAEPLLRRALEIQPDYEAAKNNLAMVLGERGDYRAAFRLFKQTGTESEAYSNMGFVYSRKGEIAKAEEAYNHALTLDPQMRVAAEALVQLSQFEKRTDTMIAQQSRPHIDAGQAVPGHVSNASSLIAEETTVPRQQNTNPASTTTQAAAYAVAGEQRSVKSAQTAEFVTASKATRSALPVVYPEAVAASAASSMKRLPPISSANAESRESLDARLQAIGSGFAETSKQ